MKMKIRYIPELALLASVPGTTESEMLRYPHSSRAVPVGMAGINSQGGYVRDTPDAIAWGMAPISAGSVKGDTTDREYDD